MNSEIYQNVLASIIKIMNIAGSIDLSHLSEETELDSLELGMSSIEIVMLFVELEELYKIQFSYNFAKIKTIGHVVTEVEKCIEISLSRKKRISSISDTLFGS